MVSSFQIKGLLKINGMLKETDKQKQIDEFETIISNFKKITDSFIGNCKDETIKKIIIDCYYNNKS